MRLAIVLLLLMVFTACETKEHADAEVQAIKKAQGAAAKAATHANSTLEEEIGIPECDNYIRKYEACLADKVPADAQTRFRNELDEQTKRWRASANHTFERSNVADQCRSAMAVAKQTMADFGCDF